MDYRIFLEPQNGGTFADQLAAAKATEDAGFGGFFRSDHFVTMDTRKGGLPGPTDSWVTLGAIATHTTSIRLGTLVSSATFRHPSLTAIQVAQVDAMSGGRVDFGLGTGWFEAEHVAYGFPFPAKRFGPFQEQLAIITGLWGTPIGETYSFAGEHFRLDGAPALPKPTQQHVPMIVGGTGPSRTPAIAARFADEYNGFLAEPDVLRARFDRLDAACADAGRDPGSIVRSIATTVVAGDSPAEIADRIGPLAELGVTRVYLQLMDLRDLDHLEAIAGEVLPAIE